MGRVVYYDETDPGLQMGFRCVAAAWWVVPGEVAECLRSMRITEPLYWALHHLGIVDALYELPITGIIGPYEEGIVLNEGLPRFARMLRDQADRLEPAYDWLCAGGSEGVSYRIKADRPTLRSAMLELTTFVEEAAQCGHDVQLWL